MRFCYNCRKEILPDTKFCPYCGTEAQKIQSKPPPEKKSKSAALMFIIIVVLAVIIAIVIKDKSKDYSKSYNNIPEKITMYVYKKINIRQGPGINYKKVGHLSRGDIVKIDSTVGEWVVVSKYGERQGYVFKSLLKSNPIPAVE